VPTVPLAWVALPVYREIPARRVVPAETAELAELECPVGAAHQAALP
jgi:hypothetical protein